MAATAPPRHRGWYRTAVVVALAMLVGGVVLAVPGYLATFGPGAAVTGYFAALERGDAPAALGFGALPAGPRSLLTSTVLRAQQRIAPIGELRVVSVSRHGSTASATVRYTLDFGSGPRQQSGTVPLVRRGRSWRLVRTAVPTRLDLSQASDRATILGTPLPDGVVLLFPGAVPVSFDTPYLQLEPSAASVSLHGGVRLAPQLSVTGRAAVLGAVQRAVRACLSGSGSFQPRCPLPSDRYVPGSVHGSFAVSALQRLGLAVSDDPAGVVTVSSAGLRVTGSYTVLDFDDRPVSRKGALTLPVSATVSVQSPPVLEWTAPQ